MLAHLHLPRGITFYEDALEGLVRVNAHLYRLHPEMPSIYKAGVKYKGFDPTEEWRTVAEVIRDKVGDCEDLASARAGELRARGDAGAHAIVVRTGPHMTHAKVMRGDGIMEDPSRQLGMGQHREQIGGVMPSRSMSTTSSWLYPQKRRPPGRVAVTATAAPIRLSRASAPAAPAESDDPYQLNAPSDDGKQDAYRREDDFASADSGQDEYGDLDEPSNGAIEPGDWEQLGADPSADAQELQWVVHKTGDGWQGVVKVPLNLGRALLIARTGETKQAATSSALSSAASLLDNPMIQSVLPPGAKEALSIIRSPAAQKAAAIAFDVAKKIPWGKLKFW